MFFRSFLTCVATISVCGFLSVRLTLITIGGIVPIIIVAIFYAKMTRKLWKERQDQNSLLGQVSTEAISNVRTVKGFANERNEEDKYRKINENIYKLGKKIAMINAAFTGFSQAAIYGCMALIIWSGTNLVFAGELSIGDISAFLLYMMQLVINFAVLALVLGNVSKIAGASSRVITMMQKIPGVNSRGGITIPEDEIIG